MNSVYAVIANHKKVTKKGIIHATNLPPQKVDVMLEELINLGVIYMKKSYTENGYTINTPVYKPVNKFIQLRLNFLD